MSSFYVTPVAESDVIDQLVAQCKRLNLTVYQVSDLIQKRYDVTHLCQLSLTQIIDLHNHLITL